MEKNCCWFFGSGAFNDLRNSRGFFIVCKFPPLKSLFAIWKFSCVLNCSYFYINYLFNRHGTWNISPASNSRFFISTLLKNDKNIWIIGRRQWAGEREEKKWKGKLRGRDLWSSVFRFLWRWNLPTFFISFRV